MSLENLKKDLGTLETGLSRRSEICRPSFLYFDDIPILTIGDEITFCEYTGGLFKGDDKRISYRNMQEFKDGIEKRT